MGSRRRPARLVALVVLAAILAGCAAKLHGRGAAPKPAQDLGAAARSLVPAGAKVVAQATGDCVELAASPSCVTVYFAAARRGVAERVRLVGDAARGHGWTHESVDTGESGTLVDYRRGGLRANVALWNAPRASCGRMTLNDCGSFVDHVRVVRMR